MARAFSRETMIALRARQRAYRIAADFLYEQPIDVDTFGCRSCGQQIRPELFDGQGLLCCPVCGLVNQVPDHLRSRTTAPAIAQSGMLDYRADDVDEQKRRRLVWIIVLVIYAAAVMAWLVVFAGLR